jgi:hypothetical protein
MFDFLLLVETICCGIHRWLTFGQDDMLKLVILINRKLENKNARLFYPFAQRLASIPHPIIPCRKPVNHTGRGRPGPVNSHGGDVRASADASTLIEFSGQVM